MWLFTKTAETRFIIQKKKPLMCVFFFFNEPLKVYVYLPPWGLNKLLNLESWIYPIPLWSFWFPGCCGVWTETGIVPCLVLWALLTWGSAECWACLVLSIACRLVEDLALDVSWSWRTYPAYGSLALRVHWSAVFFIFYFLISVLS